MKQIKRDPGLSGDGAAPAVAGVFFGHHHAADDRVAVLVRANFNRIEAAAYSVAFRAIFHPLDLGRDGPAVVTSHGYLGIGGAESLSNYHATTTFAAHTHPFAVDATVLRRTLLDADLLDEASLGAVAPIRLTLPCNLDTPCPSDRLSIAAGEVDSSTAVELRPVAIPAVAIENAHALAAILRLEDRGPTDEIAFGHSLPWWIALARFVVELLEDQRFIRAGPTGDPR